jgi:hypothetical protein
MRSRPVSMVCSYTPRTAISSISFYATERTAAPMVTAAPSKTVSDHESGRSLEPPRDCVLGNARVARRKHFPARDTAARSRNSPCVQGRPDPELGLFARRCVTGPEPGRSRCNCIWSAFPGRRKTMTKKIERTSKLVRSVVSNRAKRPCDV